MIKTVMALSICGIVAFAAPVQSGQGMKSSYETNATKSSTPKKTGFQPSANQHSMQMHYNTPYYPRGTIATH